ncbi:tetratricopeptide repeat protein [Azohydromonas caseinilytica]|uniref:Tetratricopeptide repeat protein n=1 Tax=Azohydromonas caseinilytica TaxID=2728836 RepID=A0A848FFN1_9BURK|nr:hypothetical protein [Azohydromonas caseinilytica]NML19037.1 hypothetical protein [Azohydromonas caseinilytica]
MEKLFLAQDLLGKTRISSTPQVQIKVGRLTAGCCLAILLGGCASSPRLPEKPSEVTPKVVSMDEWMTQAKLALSEGNQEKARTAYRAAAQSHPTEKLPWLRLSENYFNAQDYGNAILMAQEALQRDGQDHVAHSILAVSGLRITAGSLVALRQEGSYPVGSRDEAITVARALRDTLGAASLLTPPSQPSVSRLKKPVVQRPAASAGNPLDKLK